MLDELLENVFVGYINNKKAGNLPLWTKPVVVETEDIEDRVFDIRDNKGQDGSIKCVEGSGDATYFNGDEDHQYVLRFIFYEKYINQFRTFKDDGKIDQDWTKDWCRPDYLAFDTTCEKRCMIIHELSSGNIRNKRQDGKKQLLKTVVVLNRIPAIKAFFEQYSGRCFCILSARGCVDVTPHNMADSFMEIYHKLPDPIPIPNSTITKNGFKAFETKVVKL